MVMTTFRLQFQKPSQPSNRPKPPPNRPPLFADNDDLDSPPTATKPTPAVSLPSRLLRFSPTVIKSKGIEAVQMGQLPEAMEAFSGAVIMDPVNQHLYLDMLAQLFLSQGEFFKAILTCDKAIHFNPGYFAPHHTRSRALLNFGELDGAIAELETGLVLASTDGNDVVAAEMNEMKYELEEARNIRRNICETKHQSHKLSVCLNDRIYGDVNFYTGCDERPDLEAHSKDAEFLYHRLRKPNCCNLIPPK